MKGWCCCLHFADLEDIRTRIWTSSMQNPFWLFYSYSIPPTSGNTCPVNSSIASSTSGKASAVSFKYHCVEGTPVWPIYFDKTGRRTIRSAFSFAQVFSRWQTKVCRISCTLGPCFCPRYGIPANHNTSRKCFSMLLTV